LPVLDGIGIGLYLCLLTDNTRDTENGQQSMAPPATVQSGSTLW